MKMQKKVLIRCTICNEPMFLGDCENPDKKVCDSCLKADFTTFCPVCNTSIVLNINKSAWDNWLNDDAQRIMWTCLKCGVYYNPRIKGSVGEFTIERTEKEKSSKDSNVENHSIDYTYYDFVGFPK